MLIFLPKIGGVSMVGTMRPRKPYKRIRFDDRKKIEELCAEEKTVEEIAAIIGVNSSTIYRELARGGEPYCAATAQINV